MTFMEMKSGTELLRNYLEEHVGEEIPLKTLNKICEEAGLHHWDRVIRNLIQLEGWDIENSRGKWYKLRSLKKREVLKKRGYISKKDRYLTFDRDNHTCQGCGRTVKDDGIKLTVDHIIPVDWGGVSEFDNYQALCSECNEGKQAWVSGEDAAVMKLVSEQTNTEERLRVYFQEHPNEEIDVARLMVVAKTREWTRQLRHLRQHYGINIVFKRRNKKENRKNDSYIYVKED